MPCVATLALIAGRMPFVRQMANLPVNIKQNDEVVRSFDWRSSQMFPVLLFFCGYHKTLIARQYRTALLQWSNTLSQSNLWKERVYFNLQVIWSLAEQSQSRNQAVTWISMKSSTCWLAYRLLLPYTVKNHLPRGWPGQQWKFPPHQLTITTISCRHTHRPVWSDSPSIESPQVSRICVKLTAKANMDRS